jgi:hypothetical protein
MQQDDIPLIDGPRSPQDFDPFISDAPVTDPQLDRFKRVTFAERVAKTLALRRDSNSIVVLINGRWGEGKSTVLEYIHGALFKFGDVVPVRFNPWLVSGDTSLLLSFFATIATALDKSPKTKKEQLGDVFRKYGDVVGEISVESHGTKLSTGRAVSKLGAKLSMVTLDEKKERVAEMLTNAKKRVVVFLDDIDRLDRKEAQSVFKLLKLTGDLKHVSYVLAFDRDTVAEAIGEQYGAGNVQSGHQYMEKVVQVNLDLPLADSESLAQLCIDGINDALHIAPVFLSPDQEREFQVAFLQHIIPGLRTPRLAKLYANAVAFVLPLLANEVNPVDILLLEAIKFLYPNVHADIRNFPEVYTGDFGWDLDLLAERGQTCHDHLAKVLEQVGKQRAKRAQDLLTDLFPQLRELFESQKYGEGDREGAQREQRVSSLDYLRRYLTCSIPVGDVSDREVDEFLRHTCVMNESDLENRYVKLFRPAGERTLFIKLKRRVEDLRSDCAAKLCIVVAKHGSLIPDSQDIIFASPMDLAGLLIRVLLQRVEVSFRKEVAHDVLTKADPLFFAVVCLDWIRPQRSDLERKGSLFSSQDTDELVRALASRISREALTTSIVSGSPEKIGRLLSVWQQGEGNFPVKDYVEGALSANPHASLDFIRAFSAFGRTGTSYMDQAGYELVCKFVEPKALYEAFEAAGLLAPDKTGVCIVQEFEEIYAKARDATEPPSHD